MTNEYEKPVGQAKILAEVLANAPTKELGAMIDRLRRGEAPHANQLIIGRVGSEGFGIAASGDASEVQSRKDLASGIRRPEIVAVPISGTINAPTPPDIEIKP